MGSSVVGRVSKRKEPGVMPHLLTFQQVFENSVLKMSESPKDQDSGVKGELDPVHKKKALQPATQSSNKRAPWVKGGFKGTVLPEGFQVCKSCKGLGFVRPEQNEKEDAVGEADEEKVVGKGDPCDPSPSVHSNKANSHPETPEEETRNPKDNSEIQCKPKVKRQSPKDVRNNKGDQHSPTKGLRSPKDRCKLKGRGHPTQKAKTHKPKGKSHRPKVELQSPKVELQSPKVELQSPKVELQSPKGEPQSPNEALRIPKEERKSTSPNLSPQRSKFVECPECKAKFQSQNGLERHMASFFEKEHLRIFKCFHCSHAFRSNPERNMHERTSHRLMPFPCCCCGDNFPNRNALALHTKTRALSPLPTCEECDCVFLRRRYLMRHYRITKVDLPFSCKICSHKYSTKVGLNRHISFHFKKVEFECAACFTRFTSKTLLMKHINNAVKEEEEGSA